MVQLTCIFFHRPDTKYHVLSINPVWNRFFFHTLCGQSNCKVYIPSALKKIREAVWRIRYSTDKPIERMPYLEISSIDLSINNYFYYGPIENTGPNSAMHTVEVYYYAPNSSYGRVITANASKIQRSPARNYYF